MSSSYEVIYFNEFKPYLSEIEYNHYMNRIVEGNDSMWPCDFSFSCGYLLSPCTLGLSLLLPNICIQQARKSLQSDIKEVNDIFFHPRFHLSLQQQCCISWLQIDLIEENKSKELNINYNDIISKDNCDSGIKLII